MASFISLRNVTDLLQHSPEKLGHGRREIGQIFLQHNLVREPVLLEAVEERLGDDLSTEIRLLHHHQAFKGLVDTAGPDVGPNGNIGIVAGPCVGINTMKATIEEIIEALVDAVCLTQDYHVTLGGRVAHSCYGVDLQDVIMIELDL